MNIPYNIWYFYWILIDILSYRFRFVATFYHKTIGKAYKQELEEFNLYNSKNILHIGSGAYPLTALVFAQNLQSKIVSIDKNAIAVTLSKRVICKKKLGDNITIDKSDGRIYPLQQFDTIVVSGCSIPMFDLIESIFINAEIKSNIIIRLNEKKYDDLKAFIDKHSNISIKNEMKNVAYPNFTWMSLLVKKTK